MPEALQQCAHPARRLAVRAVFTPLRFLTLARKEATLGSSDPAPTPRLWRSERTLGGVYEASTANRRRVQTVLVMSKDSHIEAIDPNLLYNAEKLRRIEGISLAEMKKFIRENCVYSEAWQGRLNVLGSDYIDAMSRRGLVDSEEKKRERQRKSGASTRAKNKETTEQ